MDLLVYFNLSFYVNSSHLISSTISDSMHKIDKSQFFSYINDDLISFFWGNFIYAAPLNLPPWSKCSFYT
jgi:hypothetical protein